MYPVVVLLTMLVLPVVSILLDRAFDPTATLPALAGTWFVFWGVGVRLLMAGVRQYLQPAFTAREIFHTTSDEVLPLVRELGIANIATGIAGLLAVVRPDFVLPVALIAAIFYGFAGFRHIREPGKSRNETIAMVSDLFMFAVLALVVLWHLA